jgi:hypothetical protein
MRIWTVLATIRLPSVYGHGSLLLRKRLFKEDVSMKAMLLGLGLLALTFPVAGHAEPVILFDFEQGTESWTNDWQLKQDLIIAKGRTRHGESALQLRHNFHAKDGTVGIRSIFPEPKDFTEKPGFAGFTAWIFIPSGTGWQAQMYCRTGEAWTWNEGKLMVDLQPGWTQIALRDDEIADTAAVRDLGIQIKNYKLDYDATITIDRVEALYTDGK